LEVDENRKEAESELRKARKKFTATARAPNSCRV